MVNMRTFESVKGFDKWGTNETIAYLCNGFGAMADASSPTEEVPLDVVIWYLALGIRTKKHVDRRSEELQHSGLVHCP